MKTVILVPRREDHGPRDEVYAWVKQRWADAHPDWAIVEGHHLDGIFNRSAAVNTAARLAGDWDVAVIIDADVWTDPGKVREAVRLAHETGRMVLPYEYRRDLGEPGTRAVMEGFEGPWRPLVRRRYRKLVSSVVVVPRRLWDAFGGFDEGFRGWGAEDDAFALLCEEFGGIERLPGDVWHLAHPTAERQGKRSPSYMANVARLARYRSSRGDKAALLAIREDVGRFATGRIPRILHRVVPQQKNAQAEAWWDGFRDLHPDWTLMTHRDPLDPAEWPLTSRYWSKVAAGAQLADLVRLEALLKWGGVYVDHDVQPVRPLDPLLGVPGFAAWEDERTIPNAILGAARGHPAIRACLDLMLTRLGHYLPRDIWMAGPGVTTAVLRDRPDVLILPPETCYPVHYNAPDKDERLASLEPAPGTYAVHHYWGSWLPAKRRVAA